MTNANIQPTSVRRGAFMLLIAIAFGTLSVFTQSGDAKLEHLTWWLGPFIILKSLYVYLLYLIWRGRNWARWTLLIWAIANWIDIAWSPTYVRGQPAIAIVFTFAAAITEVFGCWQLFVPSSSVWFHPAKYAQPESSGK